MSGPMEPMRSDYNPRLDPFRQLMQGMGPRVSQTPPGRQMNKDQSRVPTDTSAPRDRPQPPRARQTTSGTPSGFRMPGEVSQYSQQPSDPAYPQGRPSPGPPSPQGAMTQPTPASFMLQALEQNMNGAPIPQAWQGLGASKWTGYNENVGDYMPPMPNPNYPIMPAPVDMPQSYEWPNEAATGDSFLLQGETE